MSPNPASGAPVPEEAPGAAARPAPASAASAAEDFGAALNGGAPAAEQAAERAAGQAAAAAPAPEAPREQEDPGPEGPARRVGSVVGADREAAAEAEPALDRPGAPMLAGAAIAGLILVAAPFAVVTGTGGGPVSLDVMAGGEPVSPALSGQAQSGAQAGGQTGGQAGGDTGSGQSVPAGGEGGGSPVTDTAPDTGYVPEVQPDLRAPTMPDPGDTVGGSAVQTSTPDRGSAPEAGPPAAEGAEADTGAVAAADGTGDTAGDPASDTAGDGEGSAGEAGTDTGTEAAADPPAGEDTAGAESGTPSQEGDAADGAAAGAQEGRGEESAAEAFSDTGSAGDGTGQTAPQDSGDAAQNANAADPAGPQDPGVPQDPSAANGGDSSVLGGVAERFAPADGSYLAVAGPGCPALPGASYGHEGRWGGAEDANEGWATRPGGYGGEGCAGEYDALPVSGDPEQGNGQYAVWSFVPGREGVSCELYVHVPDDESPLWLAPGEARYLIRPGVGTEQPPVAVFGFDQSQVRGGWVQVTGFVTPAAEFTVELTNAGADPLAAQEGASAHVAASAVRASCP
ncbi:hypothetical protein ABZ249_19955 [Nocardiopsis sp. NPDC006139]|uniref:hypothetical protein n=1 Tax=Nocardiopsis sp. NPDC006139 TaxID=3154578 RepID=UPI0033BC3663